MKRLLAVVPVALLLIALLVGALSGARMHILATPSMGRALPVGGACGDGTGVDKRAKQRGHHHL